MSSIINTKVQTSVSFNSFPSNTIYSTQGLTSGSPVSLTLAATGPEPIGTVITGAIWAQYSYTITEAGVPQTVGPYYVQVSSLTLKSS